MPFFLTNEFWTQVNLPPKPTSQLALTRPPPPPPLPWTQGSMHAKTSAQGCIDNHFQHHNLACRNDSVPPCPSSPVQTNTLAAPRNVNPPQPFPQQQTPPSPSEHPLSEPTTPQESKSSCSAMPIAHKPAPFPPILPLSNPPPMPTPLPFMKSTTPADTSPPHSPA